MDLDAERLMLFDAVWMLNATADTRVRLQRRVRLANWYDQRRFGAYTVSPRVSPMGCLSNVHRLSNAHLQVHIDCTMCMAKTVEISKFDRMMPSTWSAFAQSIRYSGDFEDFEEHSSANNPRGLQIRLDAPLILQVLQVLQILSNSSLAFSDKLF